MTLGKMCISTSVIKIESSVWYHFNPLLTGYLRIPLLDTYNRNPKHQRAEKDGRVFGFRTRKEYSEAEAGPQPGGGHGSQGEFHSLNRILNTQ